MTLLSDEDLFHVYASACAGALRDDPQIGSIPKKIAGMAAVKRSVIEALAAEADAQSLTLVEREPIPGTYLVHEGGDVEQWLRSFLPTGRDEETKNDPYPLPDEPADP